MLALSPGLLRPERSSEGRLRELPGRLMSSAYKLTGQGLNSTESEVIIVCLLFIILVLSMPAEK